MAMAIPDTYNHAFEEVGNRPRRPQPRPTTAASWELANHAKSYLEAGEYAKGYSLLQSLLAAGTSISVPAKPYSGLLAPAAHIAFASSLIAYPPITTKATAPNAIQGSDAALEYLRCVHNTGWAPAYSVVRKAFTFPKERTRRSARANSEHLSPSAGDIERLAVKQANALSIWHCAEDFWHIVGWAFNCSVAHKNRWARWKVWLEITLDFLEADWDVCIQGAKEVEDDADRVDLLQDSLLWRYISSEEPTSRSTRRRIAAAILAMADKTARQHYPEVWKNETADPKPRDDDNDIKPSATLDFENGQLGDYDDDEEDTAMVDAPRLGNRGARRQSVTSTNSNDSFTTSLTAVESLGGRDAVLLRQRFFALLANVAQELPTQFTTLEDFCDNITEPVKDTPTSIFSIIISTTTLPKDLQFAFHGNLLLPLSLTKLQNYFQRRPTQAELETLLLVRASSQSFAHNAKVSLILEQMFLYMLSHDIEPTATLRTAIETGIEARNKVYGTGKGKKGNAEEEEQGKQIMKATSARLLSLLDLLEVAAGKEPRPRIEKSESNSLLMSFGSSLSSAPESETDG